MPERSQGGAVSEIRDAAECAYDQAIADLRAAKTREAVARRRMLAGEISAEEHAKARAERRAATRKLTAARQYLRDMAGSGRKYCGNGHDQTLPGARYAVSRKVAGNKRWYLECVECARAARQRRRADA